MIKMTFCLRRAAGMTREEFQAYWGDRHAALVRAGADALGIRRYVQTHTVVTRSSEALQGTRSGPIDHFDGVAELWWDDAAALAAPGATDAGRRAAQLLLEDERAFIDLSASPLIVGVEHLIIG